MVVAGTCRDLVALMLDRNLKIQHSGQTIPGHGGVDGFLVAIPHDSLDKAAVLRRCHTLTGF